MEIVEKFLIARRLMYWQVYLHRTVISAEHMLTLILRRAKYLTKNKVELFASPSLLRFLQNDYDIQSFMSNPKVLDCFCDLDDSDIYCAMKSWRYHGDKVLSKLSGRLLDRQLFRIELRSQPFTDREVHERVKIISEAWGLTTDEASYFVSNDTIQNQAYTPNGILIKYKDGSVLDFAEANDHLSLTHLTRPVVKSFLCYPKDIVTKER